MKIIPETSVATYSWLQRIWDMKIMLAPENLDYLAEQIMNPFDGELQKKCF